MINDTVSCIKVILISDGIRFKNINYLASWCIFSGPTNESSLWKEAKSNKVAEEKKERREIEIKEL